MLITFSFIVGLRLVNLIQQLLMKWGNEAKNLIIDESWDEFESLRHILNNPNHPNINHFYNPTYIFGYGSYNPNFKGYKYPVPVPTSQNQNTKVKVNVNVSPQPSKGFSTHNPSLWLRRYARDLSEKYASSSNGTNNSRDVSLNLDLYDLMGVKMERKKRQSPGRATLCQTSTQFIMPQAALNSKVQQNAQISANSPMGTRPAVNRSISRKD
uniref:Uncharacterized protein n=1 Tax=Megaselia scalaris TaxID=36166 RepID=T1GB63_MEGSC